MLGRMLAQGLIAAALVGSAAAVYAQVKGDGAASAPAPAAAAPKTAGASDNGYLAAPADAARRHDGERTPRQAERDEHRGGHVGEDDDDDD